MQINQLEENKEKSKDLPASDINLKNDRQIELVLEDEEDVDLSEFSDEIEEWVLDEFRQIGLDTAKSVLAISKEDIARRTELEEETIDEILGILSREFE